MILLINGKISWVSLKWELKNLKPEKWNLLNSSVSRVDTTQPSYVRTTQKSHTRNWCPATVSLEAGRLRRPPPSLLSITWLSELTYVVLKTIYSETSFCLKGPGKLVRPIGYWCRILFTHEYSWSCLGMEHLSCLVQVSVEWIFPGCLSALHFHQVFLPLPRDFSLCKHSSPWQHYFGN